VRRGIGAPQIPLPASSQRANEPSRTVPEVLAIAWTPFRGIFFETKRGNASVGGHFPSHPAPPQRQWPAPRISPHAATPVSSRAATKSRTTTNLNGKEPGVVVDVHRIFHPVDIGIRIAREAPSTHRIALGANGSWIAELGEGHVVGAGVTTGRCEVSNWHHRTMVVDSQA